MLRAVIIDDKLNIIVTAGGETSKECLTSLLAFFNDEHKEVRIKHLKELSLLLDVDDTTK